MFEIQELVEYLKKLHFSDSEITELLQSSFGADQRAE
jgi:hypothetical protein